jgi:AcrR family transcriptional regulator
VSEDDAVSGSQQDDLRARMVDNPDTRATRTRRRLVEAYRELADEGEAISASAVAQRAGVRRSTFYAHFASTSDLAVETLTEVFEIVASLDSAGRRDGEATAYEVSETSLFEVIRFVAEHRSVYADLLGSRDEFTLAAEDAFADSALRTLLAQGHVHGDAVVTSRFIAAGAMGVIAWWLRERPGLSEHDLAARLAAIIPADFTSPAPAVTRSIEEGAQDGQAE